MPIKNLAVTLTLTTAFFLVACSPRDKSTEEPAPGSSSDSAASADAAPAATPPATGTESMPLQKIELAPGNGAEVKSGQTALGHYTGWRYDTAAPENKGKQFDSSLERNEPFEFPAGAGIVTKVGAEGAAG